MQNSMVMSIFSIFDQKYNFWENLVQRFQIVVLIWNCVHRLFRISRIQWWYSLFLCNTGYYNTFWTNLVQKIKIVSLIWNLVSRLIRIYRIQCWCSVSYFRPKILFLGKFGSKNQNCRFKLKFDMQNSVVMFVFSIFDCNYHFGQICSKKSKFSVKAESLYPD